MRVMPKATSLQDLLQQASEKYSVPINLLQKILDKERKRLYLFDSPRTTTVQEIREMILEEAQQ